MSASLSVASSLLRYFHCSVILRDCFWPPAKITKMAYKSNPKAFYNYVNSKTKTRVTVSYLINDIDGRVASNNKKADSLNLFFSPVFTRKDLQNIPAFEDRCENFCNIVTAYNCSLGSLQCHIYHRDEVFKYCRHLIYCRSSCTYFCCSFSSEIQTESPASIYTETSKR